MNNQGKNYNCEKRFHDSINALTDREEGGRERKRGGEEGKRMKTSWHQFYEFLMRTI